MTVDAPSCLSVDGAMNSCWPPLSNCPKKADQCGSTGRAAGAQEIPAEPVCLEGLGRCFKRSANGFAGSHLMIIWCTTSEHPE